MCNTLKFRYFFQQYKLLDLYSQTSSRHCSLELHWKRIQYKFSALNMIIFELLLLLLLFFIFFLLLFSVELLSKTFYPGASLLIVVFKNRSISVFIDKIQDYKEIAKYEIKYYKIYLFVLEWMEILAGSIFIGHMILCFQQQTLYEWILRRALDFSFYFFEEKKIVHSHSSVQNAFWIQCEAEKKEKNLQSRRWNLKRKKRKT